MAQPPISSQGAVLVISLWFERRGARNAFRARLTWTGDVRDPGASVVVTDQETVLALVRAWCDEAGARADQPRT